MNFAKLELQVQFKIIFFNNDNISEYKEFQNSKRLFVNGDNIVGIFCIIIENDATF